MLEPKFQKFDEVIFKKLFRVPPYQRGYSWTGQQRKELFEDIRRIKELKRDEHFMSTLVFHRTGRTEDVGSDTFEMLDIVDGQQRLTTLIILLKAIEKAVAESDAGAALRKTLVLGNGSMLLLQTNHDAATTLEKYLREGELDPRSEQRTLHQRELTQAFRDCERFVADWNDPVDLLRIVKNKISFVFFIIADNSLVYTVFEVLNSRGLPVDWLDKVKSALMGIAHESKLPKSQTDAIESTWSELYRVLGKERVKDEDVLTVAAGLKSDEPPGKGFREPAALDFFREACRKNEMTPHAASQFLLEVATALDEFLANPRRRAVGYVKQARLLAAAILTAPKLGKARGSRDKLLEAWEDAIFKYYILGENDSRMKVGECVRIASALFRGQVSVEDAKRKIDEIGEIGYEEVEKRVRGEALYNNWRPEAIVYLLSKYEERLASDAGEEIPKATWEKIWQASADDTIEHVFPQKPGPEWKGKLRQGVEAETIVHRLGNLMVLPPGLNSKATNKPFKEKVSVYRGSGLRHVEEVTKQKDWNLSCIEKREEALLKFIRARWW